MLTSKDFIKFIASFQIGFNLEPQIISVKTEEGYTVTVGMQFSQDNGQSQAFGEALTEVYQSKEEADAVLNDLWEQV